MRVNYRPYPSASDLNTDLLHEQIRHRFHVPEQMGDEMEALRDIRANLIFMERHDWFPSGSQTGSAIPMQLHNHVHHKLGDGIEVLPVAPSPSLRKGRDQCRKPVRVPRIANVDEGVVDLLYVREVLFGAGRDTDFAGSRPPNCLVEIIGCASGGCEDGGCEFG